MRGIILGIKKRPLKIFIYWFATFSVVWTLIEGITYFITINHLKNVYSLFLIVICGLIYALWANRYLKEVTIPIKHTNSEIKIQFGDIFRSNGVRVIAVNEFFDSELGIPVSAKSLHGMLISKCFGGHGYAFDKIVSEQLKETPSVYVGERKLGKKYKYPIGTSVEIVANSKRYLCFALTHTDINTSKAYADVSVLWKALTGLWDKARVVLGGDSLSMPLIGNGLSGIGLPPKDLLMLLILSMITESKKQIIGTRINIILHDELYDKIDLRKVKEYWTE